jgi:hypothetical protein
MGIPPRESSSIGASWQPHTIVLFKKWSTPTRNNETIHHNPLKPSQKNHHLLGLGICSNLLQSARNLLVSSPLDPRLQRAPLCHPGTSAGTTPRPASRRHSHDLLLRAKRMVAGWVAGWVAGMMTWNECDEMDHSRRFPAYLAPGSYSIFRQTPEPLTISRQSSGQVRLPRGMSTPSDTDREFSANRSWDWIFSSGDSHGGSQNKGCGILINTIL